MLSVQGPTTVNTGKRHKLFLLLFSATGCPEPVCAEETLSCRGGWRKNKVEGLGREVMEKERREKQRVNQPFYKHSLGTYCALGFERQRAGAES